MGSLLLMHVGVGPAVLRCPTLVCTGGAQSYTQELSIRPSQITISGLNYTNPGAGDFSVEDVD